MIGSKIPSEIKNTLILEISKIQNNNLRQLISGIQKYNSSYVDEQKYNSVHDYNIKDAQIHVFAESGIPILFIPSIINTPHILDISKERSLMLRLAQNGFKPYLLDWHNSIQHNYSMNQYTENVVKPIINDIAHKEKSKIFVAGYCIGGFFAVQSAFIKNLQKYIAGIIPIATPWDFSKTIFPHINKMSILNAFTNLGYIPGYIMKIMFHMLFPLEINRKFMNFSQYTESKQKTFIEIENWIQGACNVSLTAFLDITEKMLKENALHEKKWNIEEGQTLDITKIKTNALCILCENDKISPYQSTIALANGLPNSRTLQYSCGHISMILNPKYKIEHDIKQWVGLVRQGYM